MNYATSPNYRAKENLKDLADLGYGSAGQVLQTDGSGTLSWVTLSSSTTASNVSITDSGGYYVAINVEDALAEVARDISYADSPMIVTGGEISEGTSAGTFKVSSLVALLRNSNSATGALEYVTSSEQDSQTIPSADITYYICLNYNSGSPTISLSTSNPYNSDKRNIPIGRVMKDGSDNVHFLNGGFRFQDGVKRLHQRAMELRTIELESGSTIAYSGTNNFTMEAGVAYAGVNRIVLSSYDSEVTKFIPVYRDNSGGWTYGTARNTIDYTHYDDGDGTLGTIGNNRYGCFWVYKHVDDNDVYVLYGRGSYTLAEATVAKEPTKPSHLSDFGCLIGKIIAPQAGGSFADVQMVTERFFTGTAVSDHGNLTGLEDDDHPQYMKGLVEDTTPQLGGNLDTNGNNIDDVTPTELSYVHGVTSAIQTQLNAKMSELSEDDTPQLGGELDCQAHSIGFTQQSITGDGTTTIDWKLGNKFKFTFGAQNETFTFTAPSKPCNLLLVLVQDSTGGRTATWPSSVKWAGGGTAPTLSTGANAIDIISFYYDGSSYYGQASLDFS